MRWQAVCARNTAMAALPFQRELRALKRRVFGKTHAINAQSVYSGGFDQIRLLTEAGLPLSGAVVLEVGSGWYPVIPLMLRLAGAERVVLTDAHRLMDRETLGAALDFLRERQADLADRLRIPAAEVAQFLNEDAESDLETALARRGLVYRVPPDLAGLGAPVDAVVSHTVLEHIPPAELTGLFADSLRALRPRGLISHGVDHSDHREHRDPRLSRVDFLKYSDAVWRWLCLNPQDYTNRLRHSDYVRMIEAAGFGLEIERPLVDEPTLAGLGDIAPARRFSAYDARDLATTWSHLVARAPG